MYYYFAGTTVLRLITEYIYIYEKYTNNENERKHRKRR